MDIMKRKFFKLNRNIKLVSVDVELECVQELVLSNMVKIEVDASACYIENLSNKETMQLLLLAMK